MTDRAFNIREWHPHWVFLRFVEGKIAWRTWVERRREGYYDAEWVYRWPDWYRDLAEEVKNRFVFATAVEDIAAGQPVTVTLDGHNRARTARRAFMTEDELVKQLDKMYGAESRDPFGDYVASTEDDEWPAWPADGSAWFR